MKEMERARYALRLMKWIYFKIKWREKGKDKRKARHFGYYYRQGVRRGWRTVVFDMKLIKKKKKHVPHFCRVIEIRVEVWENEKCCGNASRRFEPRSLNAAFSAFTTRSLRPLLKKLYISELFIIFYGRTPTIGWRPRSIAYSFASHLGLLFRIIIG